jgi:dipeptidase D
MRWLSFQTPIKKAFLAEMQLLTQDIKTEYKTLEPGLKLEIKEATMPEKVMDGDAQELLVKSLYAAHNGVFRMSPAIADLVETSNNVARVLVKDGSIHIGCLTRSSVESSKMDLANSLRSTFELMGCEVKLSGDYPGWEPNPDSAILKVLDDIYYKMNGEKANVAACHAGLECGILGQNYPGMDMISFGPTIKGAHSPDERASISSAQKYWKFVFEILENIPKK